MTSPTMSRHLLTERATQAVADTVVQPPPRRAGGTGR
jgi:hypothetical protein